MLHDSATRSRRRQDLASAVLIVAGLACSLYVCFSLNALLGLGVLGVSMIVSGILVGTIRS